MLVAVGNVAGTNWDAWHRRFGYLDYVVVAAAIAAVVVAGTASEAATGPLEWPGCRFP